MTEPFAESLTLLSFGLGAFLFGQWAQRSIMESFGMAVSSVAFFFLLLVIAPLMCAAFSFGLLFPRHALHYGITFRSRRDYFRG